MLVRKAIETYLRMLINQKKIRFLSAAIGFLSIIGGQLLMASFDNGRHGQQNIIYCMSNLD